ncbi:regulatory LuxR family protein [Mycolicibacterium mucogenicum 261Sha1.1M5]|nr:regulatory LuxR family protein [Mycolicibacterium mucogenicum 261Sha1.1M5]
MDDRAVSVRKTTEVIASGGSVEILGEHGVGKSHLVQQVALHFRNLAWRVVEVRGIYAYRTTPFACLSLAGVNNAPGVRGFSVGAVVDELSALVGDDDALLVLEDADFIDDASWGALSAMCSRKQIPTILSRLPGSSRHRVGNQLEGLSIAPGFGVRLGPLGFDELAAVIERATGHPMHPSTTSSVFAESGGNVGLALTMVRAAIHDGKMQVEGGAWVASGTFWSNALIPYVDALLAELTDEQWDALEILALLGIVELDTLAQFTGPEVPTQLEDLALIGLYPSAGRLLVNVQPPLLVDFFRQRPAAARRHKLSKMLEAHLGGNAAQAIPFHLPDLTTTPDAPFVRIVHEHLRNRMLVAQSEWSRSPSRTTLANLIEISVAVGATQEELEALFDLAAGLPTEASEAIMVRWILLQVDHWLFISREFDRALTTLGQEARRFPRLGSLLDVRAFEVQGALLPEADMDLLPDPKDTRLDVRVRVGAHEALGAHLLRAGDLAAARAHYAAAESLDVRPPSIERTGFVIMAEYFGGHPELARSYVEQGLAAARESFDNLSIRGFCYLSALIDILDGRHWRAEESIRLALSLGEPIRQPPFVHLSLIVMGAVLAAVRGDLRTAQLLQGQYEALPVPDSLLPGGTRGWASAHITAAAGESEAGADIAEAGGDKLWSRGSKLNAGLTYLTALDLDPTAERLGRVSDRLRSLASEYFARRLELFESIVGGDAARAAAIGDELVEGGFFGDALMAYRSAQDLAEKAGDNALAMTHKQRYDELRTELPREEFGDIHAENLGSQLTAREQEITRLVLAGATNQQIADRLVLSVRTVESHMHRIMKKAGVRRRGDLGAVVNLPS